MTKRTGRPPTAAEWVTRLAEMDPAEQAKVFDALGPHVAAGIHQAAGHLANMVERLTGVLLDTVKRAWPQGGRPARRGRRPDDGLTRLMSCAAFLTDQVGMSWSRVAAELNEASGETYPVETYKRMVRRFKGQGRLLDPKAASKVLYGVEVMIDPLLRDTNRRRGAA